MEALQYRAGGWIHSMLAFSLDVDECVLGRERQEFLRDPSRRQRTWKLAGSLSSNPDWLLVSGLQ